MTPISQRPWFWPIVAPLAVGALLLCILAGVPISRSQDQPPGNGGFYFAFDRTSWTLRHGWRRIDG